MIVVLAAAEDVGAHALVEAWEPHDARLLTAAELLASLIAEQAAHREYLNVRKQGEQAGDVDRFLRDKFANAELYGWMQGEHIGYTAREGGGVLRAAAVAELETRIAAAEAAGSARLFPVRHEFPNEWARFTAARIDDASPRAALTLALEDRHYPFWSHDRLGRVTRVDVVARAAVAKLDVFDGADAGAPRDTLVKDNALEGLLRGRLQSIPLPDPIGDFTLHFETTAIDDLWIVLTWGGRDD